MPHIYYLGTSTFV